MMWDRKPNGRATWAGRRGTGAWPQSSRRRTLARQLQRASSKTINKTININRQNPFAPVAQVDRAWDF
jgi:hypothetical protein